MKTINTPESFCPSCGKRFDQASSAFGESTPKPDDITICIRCGQVMLFNLDMTVRLPDEDELADLDAATLEEISEAQVAIRKVHAANN